MTFDKNFNPGQNNTYQEYNFGPNSQNMPNSVNATINNYGTRASAGKTESALVPVKDLMVVKTAVINYIHCISVLLNPDWIRDWERFWAGLLSLNVIEKDICDTTKQQGTTFNRMLVCKVIHYLDSKGFYKDSYNAAAMTRLLEGDDQHTIRTHGLNLYPDDAVCRSIDRYIDTFKL